MILKKATLSQQIFFAMIVLVSCSLLIVAIINIKQIQKDTIKYNIERLDRKDRSVAKSIESLMNTHRLYNTDLETVFSELIKDVGHIHKLKINIYDLEGAFVASSDTTLLTENIITQPIPSGIIDSCFLSENKKIKYNKGAYMGTYRVLYRSEGFEGLHSSEPIITNQPICILDVIYDKSSQNDYIKKRNEQIQKFIKIYLLLFILSMLFGYILLKQITSPLRSLSAHLSSTNLDKFSKKKLHWPVKDEIGHLIEEYNQLMKELDIRTQQLIQSEKEGAWKKMAKQIAHEIKNPLTPMRLNVQYLLKSFHDGEGLGLYSDEWKQKLSDFSKTMVQQIDTLNRIADAFSGFAGLNMQDAQLFPVKEEVERIAHLFKNNNVVFKSHIPSTKNPHIFMDKSHLTRALNNLINNSIQARSPLVELKVVIEIESNQKNCKIQIKDNGVGISEDIQNKIFEPNFTTKNSGMGLGLAMVKKIIDDSGGKINYTTSKLGTTFVLILPLKNKIKTQET